jgi:hypothetical protein
MLQALNLLVANSPTTWFYFILHPDLFHVEKWRKENNGSRQSYSHDFESKYSVTWTKWEKSSLTNTNGSPEPKIEDVWRAGMLVEGRHTTTQQTHHHPLQRSEKTLVTIGRTTKLDYPREAYGRSLGPAFGCSLPPRMWRRRAGPLMSCRHRVVAPKEDNKLANGLECSQYQKYFCDFFPESALCPVIFSSSDV